MAHTFVKDIMKKNVVSIDSSMSIKEAAIMMDDANVGCIVITQNNNPVGILTERDFVKRVAAKEKALTNKVGEVMSSPLISIGPEETIWDAAEIMQSKRIHKVPVLEGNNLLGIVTATDIVEVCSFGSDSSMRSICDQILLRLQKDKPN